MSRFFFFFFQAEDGIRDLYVTGVQTCALPIWTDNIVYKGSTAYALRYTSGNKLSLYRPDQGVIANSTVSVTDTGWHHVVATKSGADVHLYLDGVDVTGAVTNRTLANS